MIKENLQEISGKLPSDVKLVAVSKFHPGSAIVEAYDAGQRVFAESRPQELQKKVAELGSGIVGSSIPADSPVPDIEWQFIGHLQTNKLKMVLPYVTMVQSVDSVHLLEAVDKWCKDAGRTIDVLLELHIGAEDTKQGFHEEEILDVLFNAEKYRNVRFRGLMGMASLTDDEELIRADFARISSFKEYLDDLFPELEAFDQLSIGMSDDWHIALEYGATMVRIGTSIFGPREY